MLFLFGPLNHYLMESLYNSNYYHLGVPMLIAAYFACRGFRDGIEMTILILYMLWAVVTRVLNGDLFLLEEGDYLIDQSTMILMFAPGILLRGKKREWYFRSVSCILIVFYFAASLVCIYAAATNVVQALSQHVGKKSYFGIQIILALLLCFFILHIF